MDYLLDEKGASARQLVLMFLAAVAVCAVFFSLGFVVGYNHAPSRLAPTTENVSASGNIPPTVNPPAGGSSESSTRGMQTENISPGSASVPQPERPAPSPQEPIAAAKPQAPRTPAKTAPRNVTANRPAAASRNRTSSTASASSDLHFAVQVMASRTRGDAENLVKLLKSHGYPAFVRTPQQAHTKDNLFRVQVGPFSSRVAADATRDKLVGEGFKPFVVHF